MATTIGEGRLVVIGGAEDRPGTILQVFLDLAGGRGARIAVMTAATDQPAETEREYAGAFHSLGAAEVYGLRTVDRAAADSRRSVEIIHKSTGVFMTGGSQQQLVGRIRGTATHEALLRGFAEGLVIGGTSAGASAMSQTMLVSGESEADPYQGIVELGPGLGFLPGAVVDQHFAQRGRIGRLLGALAERPDDLGLGLAENTALVVSDGWFEVAGEGAVTVLDAARLTHCARTAREGKQALALCGVTLHTLPSGYGFDMKARVPHPPGADARSP